ncbi:hypothetical protein [Leptothoe sp. PORK10 BA2]|uniref:hypothetical protein n=1 Tax=Leptothoe sp. PORK10 BA2 TaxID=3110254 RepID=UPI002B1F4C15|nr:hypothetical protein [Leptothoe sp. PORK10 BA2]MEA5462617.1 hypothetical protein [Leptothoe sp. PORK10 BA2]
MAVLSLKTELDVAQILLDKGWIPEEINGILVFPLPRAAFHHLGSENCQSADDDVIKATSITPTTIYRARQLLESAGWLDRELDSLLKSYLYGDDAWANQTIHSPAIQRQPKLSPYFRLYHWPASQFPWPDRSLGAYRRAMALKRLVSLTLVIILVSVVVLLLG